MTVASNPTRPLLRKEGISLSVIAGASVSRQSSKTSSLGAQAQFEPNSHLVGCRIGVRLRSIFDGCWVESSVYSELLAMSVGWYAHLLANKPNLALFQDQHLTGLNTRRRQTKTERCADRPSLAFCLYQYHRLLITGNMRTRTASCSIK